MAAITTTQRAPAASGNVVQNTITIARRNLLHIKADPEQIVGMTIQPLMFLVLFVFVFGGAIAGSSQAYLQFALPGILVQGIAFTPFTTCVIGLTFTNVCSHPGMLAGSANTELANVSGRMIMNPHVLTVSGVFAVTPMNAIGQHSVSPKAATNRKAPTAPANPPPNRNPSSTPKPIRMTSPQMIRTPSARIRPPITDDRAIGSDRNRSIIWMIGLVAVFAPLAVNRYRRRV